MAKAKRKAGARSAIAQHLKPRLDDLAVAGVNADAMDKQLMWPCQAEVSLSYLRQMFALLLTAGLAVDLGPLVFVFGTQRQAFDALGGVDRGRGCDLVCQ